MSTVQDLCDRLKDRDMLGFLTLFEEKQVNLLGHPELRRCTQDILPPILMEMLGGKRMSAECLVRLWRLVCAGTLLLIDNDILRAINADIDRAMVEYDPNVVLPVQKLKVYEEALERPDSLPRVKNHQVQPAVAMKRIQVSSTYHLGVHSSSDAFNFKRNLCASAQEREFLKAVRQFFPGLRAYPNVPLKNFIDVPRLGSLADDEMRRFTWSSQVDVLLCTEDEDPVSAIELDSPHHDDSAARRRDALKNKLFQLAGLPLVRIRPGDTSNVRAEDFYDLLVVDRETLDALRPRRLRPEELMTTSFQPRRKCDIKAPQFPQGSKKSFHNWHASLSIIGSS